MTSKINAGRWTSGLELELVKLYKKFRCLWMINSPTYNDLDRRYAAYVKIVEILRPEFRSLSVPKVVYKIRDLRYRYCVELTKIERAAACEQNYTPNVPWFKVMHSFLVLRFRTDDFKDSKTTSISDLKLSYDYDGVRLTLSTCQIIYENDVKVKESKSTDGEFEESGNDAENYNDVYDLRRRWCKAGAEESEEVLKIEDHLDDFFDDENSLENKYSETKRGVEKMTKTLIFNDRETNRNPDEFDEFNAFAMSIGSQLKTLNSKLVKKLEMMILLILNEERITSLQ